MRASELAKALAEQAEQVGLVLFPQGQRQGGYWCVGSLQGEPGKSLRICLHGDRRGLWSDFATKESGDLLSLWSRVKGITLSEAMGQVRRWLNIPSPQFHPMPHKQYRKPTTENLSDIHQHANLVAYLAGRGLLADTVTAFQMRAKPPFIAFPYVVNNTVVMLKYLHHQRINGEKKVFASKQAQPCLFGWQALDANTREVTLTEGEIDAMSLHQYGIPALSLPFGGGSGNKHQWLAYEFERLSGFDVIYCCFDNDEVGKETVQALIDRLGRHRVRVVTLPHKDANECLQNQISKAQMQSYWQEAVSLDPVELKPAKAFYDAVLQEFYPSEDHRKKFIHFPWSKTHGKLALRPAELSIWTGINGHGKSQFLGHLLLHMLSCGSKVCIASLELTPERLLTRLARQAGAIEQPSENYLKAIHDWYADKLWLFNLVGQAKSEQLLNVFLYARQRYDIDVFIIDSLLKLDISEDDYAKQKAFVEQLCDFKNTHGVHIHLVVHPRKGVNEKIMPNKLDAKGTGAISDLADNCFSIWRNKFKSETNLDDNPDCMLICDKQRNGSWEGCLPFWFDTCSLQYLSHATARAKAFVDYSCIRVKETS